MCYVLPVLCAPTLAGAVGILAAICRGPRKVLRRLGARALGALGWDGYVEVCRTATCGEKRSIQGCLAIVF